MFTTFLPVTGWRQARAHHGWSPLFFFILAPEVQFALLCTVSCANFSDKYNFAMCLLLLTLHVHGYHVGVRIWFYRWSTFHSLDRPLFLYSSSHCEWHCCKHVCTALYVHMCSCLVLIVVVDGIKLSTWNTLESPGKGFPDCLDQTGPWACLWEVIVMMVIEVGRSAHHEQHLSLVGEIRPV